MRILNNCEHNRKEEEELRYREEYDVGKIAGVEMERKNTKKKVTELILSSLGRLVNQFIEKRISRKVEGKQVSSLLGYF